MPTVTARLRRDFGTGYGWIRRRLYGRLDDPGPTEQERPGFGLLEPASPCASAASVEIDVLGRNLLDKAYLVTPGRARDAGRRTHGDREASVKF